MALTINGRKRKITKADFVQLGEKFKLNEKQIVNSFARFVKAEEELKKKIERSYLSLENQEKYISLLENRLMLIK